MPGAAKSQYARSSLESVCQEQPRVSMLSAGPRHRRRIPVAKTLSQLAAGQGNQRD